MTTDELIDYVEDSIFPSMEEDDFLDEDFEEVVKQVESKNEQRSKRINAPQNKLDAFSTALRNNDVRQRLADSDKLNKKILDAADRLRTIGQLLSFKSPGEIKEAGKVKETIARRAVANTKLKVDSLREIEVTHDLTGEARQIIERRIRELDVDKKKITTGFRNALLDAGSVGEVNTILQEAESSLADQPKNLEFIRAASKIRIGTLEGRELT